MSRRGRDTFDENPREDARQKIKDYCRKIVAFMCTQVGVGALLVCYALIGALGFHKLESGRHDNATNIVDEMRRNVSQELWQVAQRNNILDLESFRRETSHELQQFQVALVQLVEKRGYHGDSQRVWSFPAALMFSLSTITMIGYGNLVPKTGWGKFATVVYAFFGIPLYVLYFLNIGKVLAGCFRFLYTKLYECSTNKSERGRTPHKRIVVPSTACLWVMGGYVMTGAVMFAEWEKWSYLDSIYFCVTSLCKLGLGDFVPGARDEIESKLIMTFIYILVGLGFVAMCFNLMREEIKVKVREFREDFRQCLEDTRVKLLAGCDRRRLSLVGFGGRVNELLYAPPRLPAAANQQQALVYFGGDVQDWEVSMLAHRDNKNYTQWSLENTARLLGDHFPTNHVVVVHPKRMEYKTFSCFENFVPCVNCGVPNHVANHNGLEHLGALLGAVAKETESDVDRIPLKLVAFSKGCVVLNQFLYEFEEQKKLDVIGRISDMYWLDGGHSGGKNTWVTSKSILKSFSTLGIKVHIHVTPYQIQDDRRPWIKKEEKIFFNTVSQFKMNVERMVHCANETPNIDVHFSILNSFHENVSKE